MTTTSTSPVLSAASIKAANGGHEAGGSPSNRMDGRSAVAGSPGYG